MKRLTEGNILDINNNMSDKWDNGVFVQPNYIPTDIKEAVCFMRWNSGGRGGSCWDDEDTINEPYYNDKPYFEALHKTLDEIGVTPEQRVYIENYLVDEKDDAGSYSGYYGDYEDYKACWVELEKIYKYLGI